MSADFNPIKYIMPKIIDRVGKRYGRWTVVSFSGFSADERPRRSLWRCVCDCGAERVMNSQTLTDGQSMSCGCLQREAVSKANKTHGGSYTKLYKQWTAMKGRCQNPNDKQFHLYGGRGIFVCKEWSDSFEAFALYVGEKPPGMSLDRINNNDGYYPGNVRWATASQQLSNTRRSVRLTCRGKTMSMREWADELGMRYNTLRQRKINGWSDEAAIETPVDSGFRRNYRRAAI